MSSYSLSISITIWHREEQGDIERRMIPAFSKAENLLIQASRLSKHRRTRLSQQMMLDLMSRFGGCEPIRREVIWKLGEEVGDALRSK